MNLLLFCECQTVQMGVGEGLGEDGKGGSLTVSLCAE